MTKIHPQCENLASQVNQVLELLQKNQQMRSAQPHLGWAHLDTYPVETSLRKAISPRFEIVFAGAFSAGKSMLINALLERELLYSAEGHATGIECYIEYATLDKERVVMTFLSETEILKQIIAISQRLNINLQDVSITDSHIIDGIKQRCQEIIDKEGGVNKSELAKQANALMLLAEGFESNKDRIKPHDNATYSMEQFNFNNLTEAASYAKRGKNSAVLKRLDYYCYHPLLEDGNVLVDLPGIDAPIEKQAKLAFDKIANPETSLVICVLKSAAAGELIQKETELLETIKSNSAIRDRVFYVFNRIDDTWGKDELRQRLEDLIKSDFSHTNRIYKTSGLLGFYGSQVKNTSEANRFGLDSIFANSLKNIHGEEITPPFVNEFNKYCVSGKLNATNFRVSVNGYDTPNQNYVRILTEWGMPLMDKLIHDSGIIFFKEEITRYLTEEKRPELYKNLSDDLQPLCLDLKKVYEEKQRDLQSQPQEIELMKQQELTRLNTQLQEIGNQFYQYVEKETNLLITQENKEFNQNLSKLQNRFVSHLDELLNNFSVKDAYSRAILYHPRNATAPLLAVLVEALYTLSNSLEDILLSELDNLIPNLIDTLTTNICQQNFYTKLCHLLGDDAGIKNQLENLEKDLLSALQNEARIECDRYLRETPKFYAEGTFSIYQFRETLQQTAQAFDVSVMIEAEPAIRQLLKLDFEPKVNGTIRKSFPNAINVTLKTKLLPMVETMKDDILQNHDRARENLQQTLEKDAREKIAYNQQLMTEIKQDIITYNEAISGINNCLEGMKVVENKLPLINLLD